MENDNLLQEAYRMLTRTPTEFIIEQSVTNGLSYVHLPPFSDGKLNDKGLQLHLMMMDMITGKMPPIKDAFEILNLKQPSLPDYIAERLGQIIL